MLPCFQLCGAQGWVCWHEDNDRIAGPWDHDVVEWLTVLFLPVFPRRAWHTYDWSKESHLVLVGPHPHLATECSFQKYPIRLSRRLIIQSFLRRWLYAFGFAGVIAVIYGSRPAEAPAGLAALVVGIALIAVTVVGTLWVRVTESRTRRIRRLLGRHERGSSDPATWIDEDRARIRECHQLFGVPNFETAVGSMLDKEHYSEAMWAARLSVVKDGPSQGEPITNRVLRHPGVQRCLAAIEENPKAWLEAARADRAHDVGSWAVL